MPNEKAILTISTSGEISMEIVDDKEDFLRVMQRAVGGYVQTVPTIDGRLNRLLGVGNAVMICNEERLFAGFAAQSDGAGDFRIGAGLRTGCHCTGYSDARRGTGPGRLAVGRIEPAVPADTVHAGFHALDAELFTCFSKVFL